MHLVDLSPFVCNGGVSNFRFALLHKHFLKKGFSVRRKKYCEQILKAKVLRFF